MDRGNAWSLFKYEAERCGLDPEWRFHISVKMRMTFGLCVHATKTIKLNALYIQNADDADILDTIRHEIAHALVGPGRIVGGKWKSYGHGPEWRRKAREIGCSAKRCGTAKTHGRHIGNCDKCGHEFTRSKSPVTRMYIGNCGCSEYKRSKRPRRGATYTCPKCKGAVVFDRTVKESATYSHKHCGGTIKFADRGVQYEAPRELVRK